MGLFQRLVEQPMPLNEEDKNIVKSQRAWLTSFTVALDIMLKCQLQIPTCNTVTTVTTAVTVTAVSSSTTNC